MNQFIGLLTDVWIGLTTGLVGLGIIQLREKYIVIQFSQNLSIVRNIECSTNYYRFGSFAPRLKLSYRANWPWTRRKRRLASNGAKKWCRDTIEADQSTCVTGDEAWMLWIFSDDSKPSTNGRHVFRATLLAWRLHWKLLRMVCHCWPWQFQATYCRPSN